MKPRFDKDNVLHPFLVIRDVWTNSYSTWFALKENRVFLGLKSAGVSRWKNIIDLSFDNDNAPYDGEWIRVCIQIYNNGERYILYSANMENRTMNLQLSNHFKLFPESEGTVTVGNVDQSNPFEGEITNLFIYSRLLTINEMKATFEYDRQPPVNNVLVGWWEFDRQLGKARIPV